jgi:hypothetical protein
MTTCSLKYNGYKCTTGESMAKYTKKLMKKYQVFKKVVFHENTRKYIEILIKFHFENIEPSIGFIVNQLQIFKKIGIIKLGNKYV